MMRVLGCPASCLRIGMLEPSCLFFLCVFSLRDTSLQENPLSILCSCALAQSVITNAATLLFPQVRYEVLELSLAFAYIWGLL